MATPVRKTTEIKKKKRGEYTLPHLVETCTVSQSNKNTLSYTKKELSHSHNTHTHTHTHTAWTHGHSGGTPLLGL